MMTIRRAEERHHDRRGKQGVWLTFYPRDRAHARADHFGPLKGLSERRLPPGAIALRTPHHDAEIVTYVCEGALAYEDAPGRSGVMRAGEFQVPTAWHGNRPRDKNASRSDWARVFQLLLVPSGPGLGPGHEHKRFSMAQRRGGLCVVASGDGRRGSLRIHQDALMCSALLDPGQHLVHELPQGRIAWLHLVEGEVTLGDIILTTGDGAGVTAERAVSLTAASETEILLLDLRGEPTGACSERVRDS